MANIKRTTLFVVQDEVRYICFIWIVKRVD